MQWIARTSYSLAGVAAGLLFVASVATAGQDLTATVEVDAVESNDAQVLLEQPAHLTTGDVTLPVALAQLHQSAGVPIVFSESFVPSDVQVRCECMTVTVREALDQLLGDTDLRYAELRSQVLIEPRPQPVAPSRKIQLAGAGTTSLPLVDRTMHLNGAGGALGAHTSAVQQEGTITGQVVDARTERPLSGAQVFVPDTGAGTLTNAEGEFTLSDVPAGEVAVRVQMIGYAPGNQTVNVVAGETVAVSFGLREQALALDEIVATGTPGGAQRRSLGNVVDRLDVADLRVVSPARDVQEVLAGRIAGVSVDPGGGQVGASGAPIRIRGSSSMALPNDPIVYIDGVRMNSDPVSGNPTGGRDGRQSRLNDINPEDIAHIEVIKGPAAATLFGTEASNGVIQIFTKQGEDRDTPQFDVRLGVGGTWFHNPAGRLFDQVSTNEDGEIFGFEGGNILTQEALTGEGNVFGTGINQDYSLNVRGGTGPVRYFASARQNRGTGTVDWNWTRTTQARANVGFEAREDLDIQLRASYKTGDTRQTGQFFANAMWADPSTNVHAGGADSRLRGWNAGPPESLRDDLFVTTGTDRANLSATMEFSPLEWLSTNTTFGIDNTETSNESLWMRDPLGTGGWFGANSLGRKDVTRIQTAVMSFDHASTARYRVSEQLGGASSFGAQFFDRSNWQTYARGDQLPSRSITTVGGAAESQGSETFVQNITVGAFVQQELNWANRIFLTGAVRADDNSAFGTEFDAAIYPKAQAAWVLHEEDFFDIPRISQLRLRSAWGQAGMQPDVFDAVRLYSVATGPGDLPVFTPSSFGNPNLQPEVGSEWEVGFDAGFIEDRISLEFTQFFRTTSNAIVQQQLAPSGGFPGSQLVNLADVRNWGTEIGVNGVVAHRGAFRWDLGGNLSYQRNEIGDLGPDREFISVTGVVGAGARQHREGFPLAGWFAPRVLSADFVEGDRGAVTNIMCDGGTGRGGVEMGGEAVPCEDAPRVFWGSSEPTWLANLNTTFEFGNFTLRASADGRGGHVVMDNGINAASTSFANTRKANEQTDPIFQAYRAVERSPIGFHNGGFVKLRELSLRYRIPDQWVAGLGAHNASLTVAGRNVATLWQQDREHFFSGERILDPEIARPGQAFQGEQQAVPPPLNSVDLTFRLSF